MNTWKIEAGTQKGGSLTVQLEGEAPRTNSVQLVGKDKMRIIYKQHDFFSTDQAYEITDVYVRTKSPF